ncbi:1-deoxy-D-xylulose-5-phosphate reductoisomerase [Aliidiomarina halalkaliphila]|uniref:1-deoxy-D-xylulose 5-phosphate reductoisomerase n=1 Tax=Aliidiomarina halalkaliphila TaxID=2593535 RepID=A0A552X3K8_9GAMM|nr:1-deoxy-D-xylulose-5-phosphate reductoisomerase [Aliidiomarina halalkaliphila]TRW49575.1 1-deoxy-D-xylulose-5-phosphate reductoisomerase [Aliidiomarina halalkaliphila]
MSPAAVEKPPSDCTQRPQTLTILGATGSIGASTLAVIAAHPEAFSVYALTAHSNVDAMFALCEQHRPQVVVMSDGQAAQALQQRVKNAQLSIQVSTGTDALCAVAAADDVDTVMAAIVGAAGLLPTLAAVHAGKRVLLANKEALVMSGQLFMDAVHQSGAQLLPVDSEHNAIFQALPFAVQQGAGRVSLADHGVSQILLTGSGGPFRETPLSELAAQTPQAACKHPNWSMGQKISVDSATMLNKGLEYIEARWLFNCQPNELNVVIHPQSVIHSMVQYVDGSVLAQMGQPDMRTPIAHCLSFPERIASGVAPLDFAAMGALTFNAPDAARYPCLQLAIDACWAGQAATTSLNAANEVAVAAFLQEKIQFGDIAKICQQVLDGLALPKVQSLDEILACDEEARAVAMQQMSRF